MNTLDPNDKACVAVVCRDGNSLWVEERDHETFPVLPATTNVIAGFATMEDALAMVAEIEADGA